VIPGIFGVNHFTTNSEGIRAPEMDRSTSEYRFLAIGGSTTEGRHVDDSEVWTAILAQRLGQTADGRDTWVGNVGQPLVTIDAGLEGSATSYASKCPRTTL